MATAKEPTSALEIYHYTNGKASGVRTLRVDGCSVIAASGKAVASLKEKTKVLADEAAAHAHAEKERSKNVKAGYVHLRTSDLVRGDVCVRAWIPRAARANVDSHPAGHHLVAAVESDPTVMLRKVDLRNGEAIQLHAARSPQLPEGARGSLQSPTGHWTAASRGVVCLGQEAVLYELNGRTWRVPFDGSTDAQLIASFDAEEGEFHDHSVGPSRDATYSRALVFDAGMVMRVIDVEGASIWETSVSGERVSCAAISHSGGFVVGCFEGPGDSVVRRSEVRVWNVSTGAIAHRFWVDFQAQRVALAPDDRHVMLMKGSRAPRFSMPRLGRTCSTSRTSSLSARTSGCHRPPSPSLRMGYGWHSEAIHVESSPFATTRPSTRFKRTP